MKKFGKLLTIGLMFILYLSVAFTGPSAVLLAGSLSRVGITISVSNIPSKGTLGEVIEIPTGLITEPGVDVRLVITDPKGVEKYNQTHSGAETTIDFVPTLVGDYKIRYSASAETIDYFATNSDEYTLTITGTKPVFAFEANTEFILPSTIGESDVVVLPLPTVTLSDGETEVVTEAGLANFSVTGYTPSHNAIVFGTVDVDGVSHYTFTPTADTFGTYTITYTYQDTTTGLYAKKTYSVQVEEDFDASDIDMNFTFSGSIPTSAVLGQEVTLPTPVTVDKNNADASIESYSKVTVQFVPAGKTETPADWITIPVDQQDFTFTPMYEAKSGSYYYISYEISSFFDLADDVVTITKNYTLNNVTDSVAPSPLAVANYVLADIDTITPVSVSYLIPSKIATSTTVTLPAIYATDNYNLPSEITLSRVIINPNSVETTLSGDKFSTVNYTFDEAGTYYVRYQATDVAGKTNTSVSYKVVVVDGFTDIIAPRVTMPSMVSTAELGETVSFSIPTAVDYASASSTEKNTVDQNLQLTVSYYFDADSANKTTILLDEEDSTKYSFVVPTSTTASTITVVVEATDDFANLGTNSSVITLINTNDTVAPTVLGLIPDIADVDQMETVTIPTITYTDNNISLLSASVSVYDVNGNKVSVKGLQIAYGAANVTVSGSNFVASLAGSYTVVFTVTDAGGNSLVNAARLFVNDTVAPIIEVKSVPTTAEIGVAITLPTPVIKDDGEVIANYADNVIEFVGDNPAYTYVQGSMKFTPNAAGTYTFRYVGEDDMGLTVYSAVYTITASDTTKPTLELEDDITFPVTAPLTPVSEGSSVYEVIEIPSFTIADSNGIREYSVKVTNPSGDTILNAVGAGYLNANGHYEFTPTKNGSYTVNYSVTDNSGNTTTSTKTIAVGDVTKPVITIANATVNAPSTATVGDTLSLDIASITLTDNVDGTIDENDYLSGTSSTKKFVITLSDPDGNAVSEITDTDYEYELSKAGTYKLVYSLTDAAGNTTTKTYYIEVSATSSSATISQEAWGTVLIVLSVALLAGVVLYFVVTRNKKAKKPVDLKK